MSSAVKRMAAVLYWVDVGRVVVDYTKMYALR
jgi:hypothetical protein